MCEIVHLVSRLGSSQGGGCNSVMICTTSEGCVTAEIRSLGSASCTDCGLTPPLPAELLAACLDLKKPGCLQRRCLLPAAMSGTGCCCCWPDVAIFAGDATYCTCLLNCCPCSEHSQCECGVGMRKRRRSLLDISSFSCSTGLQLLLYQGLLSGGLAPTAAVATAAVGLTKADSALALLLLFTFLHEGVRPNRQECLLRSTACWPAAAASCCCCYVPSALLSACLATRSLMLDS